MTHSEPDPVERENGPANQDEESSILDPVRATEPENPEQEPSTFEKLVSGPGAISGGAAGPAQQTGGTPAP